MQDTLIEAVWGALSDAYGSTHALDVQEFDAKLVVDRLRKGGISDVVIRNLLCEQEAKGGE